MNVERLKEKARVVQRGVAPILNPKMLPLIGCGLALALTTASMGKIVPYTSGVLEVDGRNVAAAGGGVFSENVAVKSLTVGKKTMRLESGDFREPIAVRLYQEQPTKPDEFAVVADNEINSAGAPIQFALSKEMPVIKGMTALDAISSPDFGRMLIVSSDHFTRTQIFLPVPEIDDDPNSDDENPELLLISPVSNVTMQITPILSGTADKPETLVFGKTTFISPSMLEAGATNVSMVFAALANPQRLCVIGLDLSGDLGVLAGQSVVGFQLDVPPSSSGSTHASVANANGVALNSETLFMNYAASGGDMPVKMVAVGVQDQGTVSQLAETFPIGDVLLGSVSSPPSPASVPGLATVPPFSNTPFDSGFNTPGVPPRRPPPPPPIVPAPAAAALLGMAAAMVGRRRKIN